MKGRTALMVLWPAMVMSILMLGGCGDAKVSESGLAARVGSTTITQTDVQNRVAVEVAYGGDSLPYHSALTALINDALEREVAGSLGLMPDSAQIRAFIEHVETTTRAPDVLARVQHVFGTDTAAYVRQYLEPRIIADVLRGYQTYDTVVQAAGRQRIEKAYGLVSGGSTFAEAAGKVDGVAKMDTLVRADTVGETSGADLVRLAETLQPGRLFEQVLETSNAYLIVRLYGRDREHTMIEALYVPKEQFEEWLHRVAHDIPIVIRDEQAEAAIQRDHSTVWWLKK